MNKSIIYPAVAAFLLSPLSLRAHDVKIEKVEYRGPVEIVNPWFTDSVDVNNKAFSTSSLLDSQVNPRLLPKSAGDTVMVFNQPQTQLHFLSFPFNNSRFASADINVEGAENFKIFVDDKETGPHLKLKPGTHEIAVKFLTVGSGNDTIRISASSPQAGYISTLPSPSSKRSFTLEDVLYAEHLNGVKVSPSGKFALLFSSKTTPDNNTSHRSSLIALPSGNIVSMMDEEVDWLPNIDMLWKVTEETDGSRSLVKIDPLTLSESVIAENIPEGGFAIVPNLKYLIYSTSADGPKEDPDIYRVINPEDRQPGYRHRSGLAVYDLDSGIFRPITFGNTNVYIQDISPDGNRLLLTSQRNRMGKRPTNLFSLFEMDLNTMKVDTLVFEDGFITGADYSPDASKIVIAGSPEALGGVGKNLPDGRIPSMVDGQLFIMDLSSKDVTPITKNFNPSVQFLDWNEATGNIYFTAEDKDRISLFSYDPAKDAISKLNLPEDIVKSFSFASDAPAGAFIGESASNPDVLYSLDFKKGKWDVRPVKATGEKLLAETELAQVVDWDFVNSVGDTINGRFYLPPGFDPDKKYPMIVNYYGGCSPTSKNFATRYPHHLYANQGYVVYVINPSGATGFGQEFSSRHVNTAGEGVARDILEGTQQFIDQHPFVDSSKIGCIGASYGGFMTQYLQTVSDLFAAAISHAGISDHTSYWGNGYWGYSYSEVSMADSYPWSETELFVNQSPLYNADKINTPILFLHGDGDTNVPPMESVQLFTALKLLGKDTALVEVTDQNHHILDLEKRKKWQDTIFAWFAKYLQDDPTWWDELYPPTPL